MALARVESVVPPSSETSIVPVLIALLAVAASLALFLLLRGRRVACPPSCRLCGYDVSRRPADSTRCSECGAELAGAGAIVTSRRTRPLGVTLAAGLLAVVALLYFTHQARRFDWAGGEGSLPG